MSHAVNMGKTIVIIGGGIAATTCLETLINEFKPGQSQYQHLILISESRLLRRATNYSLRGRNLENFDIDEVDSDDFIVSSKPDGLEVKFVHGHAQQVDSTNQAVIVNCDSSKEEIYKFDILVICIGSSPTNLEVAGSDDPDVQQRLITIRDIASVEILQQKLSSSRRVAIIGNGGVSLELINKISKCEKVWIVRDKFIGHPFLDPGASKFLIDSFDNITQSDDQFKQFEFRSSRSKKPEGQGPALGPYWLQKHNLEGSLESRGELKIIYQSELSRIMIDRAHDWPLILVLSNEEQIECDLIIVAIGVSPNRISFTHGRLKLSDFDSGIIIDEQMRTSLRYIYAAGDVVSCEEWPSNSKWFQMRLWTQARQMGHYCGQCIIAHLEGSDPSLYFNFECFTHSTKFLNKKIVLLGRYNIQNEIKDDMKGLEILFRVKTNQDYVKLVIEDNRVVGATLVGDSGLEETIENLIHDQIDIDSIKHSLLDDTADLEDYFD